MQIIDGYTHCGLSKYHPIEQVRAVMSGAGVDCTVLAQHLGEYDNTYIGDIAAGDPQHFAAVGLVDHESVQAVDELEHLASSGHFRGVRYTTDLITAAPHLLHEAARLGLVVVLWAPNGLGRHVTQLDHWLDSHADARLVITHLATPDIAEAPHFKNAKACFQLARHGNVYLQLSGMKMCCPYPHEPLYDLVAQGFEHFGPDRLYWGSNYPVIGDVDDYRADLQLLLEGKLPLPEDAIERVASGNAKRLWFAR